MVYLESSVTLLLSLCYITTSQAAKKENSPPTFTFNQVCLWKRQHQYHFMTNLKFMTEKDYSQSSLPTSLHGLIAVTALDEPEPHLFTVSLKSSLNNFTIYFFFLFTFKQCNFVYCISTVSMMYRHHCGHCRESRFRLVTNNQVYVCLVTASN